MRIILLSQIYSPEPEIRVHLLGKGLVARGHHVTAITSFPNYPLGRIYQGYRQRWWQWENKDGVHVLRLPLYPDHSRSFVRRSLNYLSFAVTASLLGPILGGNADVMWVYHPPLTIGIPALWIALLRRIPFVFEIQDMWPETLAATGMADNELLQQTLGGLAKVIYRRATAITVISPGFKRNLINKGIPVDKIHVIPNWVDEEIYRPVEPDLDVAQAYGLQGRFNVVYAGNMGPAQALDVVLKAAVILRDIPELQFVMIGDGVDRSSLQQQTRDKQLDNVRFLPWQPPERMSAFYASADALLVHLKRDPLFEITIPGKTQTCLASGRPIIMAVAGDAADLITQAGAGIVVRPSDPQDLARAVRQLYGMMPAERKAMGMAGRSFFLKNLSLEILLGRYENLFQQVAKRSS